MKSRYILPLILASAAVAMTGCASGPKANPDITAASHSGKIPRKADLLFVQNAQSVSFAKGKLTLHKVNAVTIAFCDRPERFAGHMPTRNFVPMWSQGRDSFLKDPPNATLSIYDGKNVTSVVMVLRNPTLAGENLSYDVQLLEGRPPAHGGSASLFIDVIGMPLTPMSYAGEARRTVAAGGYYAGGYYGPAVVHYGGYSAYYGGVSAYRTGAAVYSGGYGAAYGSRGGEAHWGGGSGEAEGWRGSTASWGGGSGEMQGYRGGSASWGGGSGSAEGWRGNSVSWHRR